MTKPVVPTVVATVRHSFPDERSAERFVRVCELIAEPLGRTEYDCLTVDVLNRLSAKAIWRNYYRAVRVLASIRAIDRFTFHRFSRNWWDDRLEREYDLDHRVGPDDHTELRRRLRALRPRRLP